MSKEELMDLFQLRDSFDEQDGLKLVDALLRADDQRQFNFIAMLVIPKWHVLLEHRIRPDSGSYRLELIAWLMLACHGYRLPALEPHLASFLTSDICFRVVAAAYCLDKHIHVDEAHRVIRELTKKGSKIQCDFLVQPSAHELLMEIRTKYF